MARLPKMRPRTKHLCVKMHHFREHVRKGLVSINKIPTRFQLGDIATKAQPEALFVSQRESILQWESEYASKEELTIPTKHLRACDISDNSKDLCMDQHANAFSETLPPTVVQDTEQSILVGIVTKSSKGPGTTRPGIATAIGTRPGMATEIGTRPGIAAGRQPRVTESKKAIYPVLKGKALKDWIIDKGFDGKSTKAQRERPREKGKGPKERDLKAPYGHRMRLGE